MSKPFHPATIHFPIAFLFLSYGLDVVHHLRSSLPSALTSNLPPNTDLSRASYWLLAIGLLSALPAVTSGGSQAFNMISKQGMYEGDGKTIKTKVKATIAHALVNDVVIAGSAYIWWCKRQAAQQTLTGKLGVGSVSTAEAAYAPAAWMVIAEVVVGALLLLGANIGGTLTYNYGVGFSSMSSGGKKTK